MSDRAKVYSFDDIMKLWLI